MGSRDPQRFFGEKPNIRINFHLLCLLKIFYDLLYTQVYTAKSYHVKWIIHVRMGLSVWKRLTWTFSLWDSSAAASEASPAPTASSALTSATLNPASMASAMTVRAMSCFYRLRRSRDKAERASKIKKRASTSVTSLSLGSALCMLVSIVCLIV